MEPEHTVAMYLCVCVCANVSVCVCVCVCECECIYVCYLIMNLLLFFSDLWGQSTIRAFWKNSGKNCRTRDHTHTHTHTDITSLLTNVVTTEHTHPLPLLDIKAVVSIGRMLRPLEEGAVELDGDGGSGVWRNHKKHFKHVWFETILAWLVMLVENSG